MPWNNNMAVLAAIGIAVSQGGMARSAEGTSATGTKLPSAVKFAGGDRDPSLPPDVNPVAQDKVSYDEVGYASWYGPDRVGTPLKSGEVFDASAVSASHAMLPVPSFAEVTDLRSGRTILVRINDDTAPPKGQIVSLSLGAARQLGVETDGVFPVRVRRTNPPEFERIALRGGSAAAERLATPPALLNALRKRLGPPPVAVAAAKPGVPDKAAKAPITAKRPPKKAAMAPPPAAKPLAVPAPAPAVAPKPVEVAAPVAVVAAKPPQAVTAPVASVATAAPASRPPAPVDATGSAVVEPKPHWDSQLTGRSARTPPSAPSKTAAVARPAPASGGGDWYLQVAAFSSEARAKATAAKVAGTIVRAGSLYRVRVGPYASAAAARSAVGALAAKGYPGALPTR